MAEMKVFSAGPIAEESVSQTTQTPSIQLGTRREYAGESYVYCYNAGGGAISATVGVKPVTGASGYSIAATSLTDVFNPLIGVVKHASMITGDYGWVMTRGFVNVQLVSAVCAAGASYLQLALGANGKFIEASGTTVKGTAAVVAVGLNTPAPDAGGTVYAFIKGSA